MTDRRARMTVPVRLNMRELAILRASVVTQRDALRAALEPFPLVVIWDAETRINDVLDTITEARCALKRRQFPDANPAGDSECEHTATDDEIDRWHESHPPSLAAQKRETT